MGSLKKLKDPGNSSTKPENPGQKPLTVREERFCERMAVGMKQQDAITGIGYTGTYGSLASTASSLMARQDVKDYIAKLREESRTATAMSRQEMIDRLTAIARGTPEEAAMDSDTCQVDYVGKEGIPVPRQTDRKWAMTQLAKMEGWEAPTRLHIEGLDSIVFDKD